jgi:hypothetical protein
MARVRPLILVLTVGLCWPVGSVGQTIAGTVRDAERGTPIATASGMVVGR